MPPSCHNSLASQCCALVEPQQKLDIIQALKRNGQIIPRALNKLVTTLNSKVETTCIHTRHPWLNLEKSDEKWNVADGEGKFKTRAKYNNRDEAMAVITRHSRAIELEVPALFISKELRLQISDKGLPMHGHTMD